MPRSTPSVRARPLRGDRRDGQRRSACPGRSRSAPSSRSSRPSRRLRDGPRPQHGLRLRQAVRRARRDLQRAGTGHDRADLSSRRAGGGGERDAPRREAPDPVRRGARRSWWSRTTPASGASPWPGSRSWATRWSRRRRARRPRPAGCGAGRRPPVHGRRDAGRHDRLRPGGARAGQAPRPQGPVHLRLRRAGHDPAGPGRDRGTGCASPTRAPTWRGSSGTCSTTRTPRPPPRASAGRPSPRTRSRRRGRT